MRLAGSVYHDKDDEGKAKGIAQIILNSGKRYSYQELREAVPACESQAHVAIQGRKIDRRLDSSADANTDELVQQALSCIPPRSPNTGNYRECLDVLMALVSQYGEIEAERIAESWSPSIPGTTWNIAKKIRSFKKSGITLGTLFYYAQRYGFEFPKNNKPTGKGIKSSNLRVVNGGNGSGNGGGNGGSGDGTLPPDKDIATIRGEIKCFLHGSYTKTDLEEYKIKVKFCSSLVERSRK
ncbi:MAG: hypothetical protein HC908_16850 [Calothrix sp. SM1_7_51]|nr:hypothetical protein [Calothrix sp. SM1_7_51]